MIHPIPSDVDSLLIVRISYDQRNKNVRNSVFDLFRIDGRHDCLAPHNVYLRKLGRTISPPVYCHHHQNPKAEDALTVGLEYQWEVVGEHLAIPSTGSLHRDGVNTQNSDGCVLPSYFSGTSGLNVRVVGHWNCRSSRVKAGQPTL